MRWRHNTRGEQVLPAMVPTSPRAHFLPGHLALTNSHTSSPGGHPCVMPSMSQLRDALATLPQLPARDPPEAARVQIEPAKIETAPSDVSYSPISDERGFAEVEERISVTLSSLAPVFCTALSGILAGMHAQEARAFRDLTLGGRIRHGRHHRRFGTSTGRPHRREHAAANVSASACPARVEEDLGTLIRPLRSISCPPQHSEH